MCCRPLDDDSLPSGISLPTVNGGEEGRKQRSQGLMYFFDGLKLFVTLSAVFLSKCMYVAIQFGALNHGHAASIEHASS